MVNRGSDVLINYYVDLAGFMENTFLNFVVEDMVAETNRVYVMRYLESLAFGKLSIEKGEILIMVVKTSG